jgi:hypothetical protein
VTFRDAKLQEHCERVAAIASGCAADQISLVGLLDAWHWFHVLEGDDSPRTAEALELLQSPELRPALRDWYRQFGDNMNPFALEFRDRLINLIGEKLG